MKVINLNPASRTEIHKTSFAKNLKKSHFASLTPKQRREYTLRAIKVNKKPVIQYSIQKKTGGLIPQGALSGGRVNSEKWY